MVVDLGRPEPGFTGPLHAAIRQPGDRPGGAPSSLIVLTGLACPLRRWGSSPERVIMQMALEDAEDLHRALGVLLRSPCHRVRRNHQR